MVTKRGMINMKCTKCGNIISDNSNFCTYCGHKVNTERVCPSCGGKNDGRDNFCIYCGVPLKETQKMQQKPKQTQEQPKQDYTKQLSKLREQHNGEESSFYLIDFLKRLTDKENITVLIYLILNVVIICGIVSMFADGDLVTGSLWGILIYAVSLSIALSPIGEWILRFQTGCKEIKEASALAKIEPLFNEVYAKAKLKAPSLPDDIRLYICDDMSSNAFATGRKTVCVTRGMLENESPECIKATLGHEFGHLAHKDTDLVLLVTVGNMIVTGLITVIRFFIIVGEFIFHIISLFAGGEEGFLAALLGQLTALATLVFVNGCMWIWTKLGTILVMKASRNNEYSADEFSYRLGYGESLCELLNSFGGEAPKGLFANLQESHPANQDRIARLKSLG